MIIDATKYPQLAKIEDAQDASQAISEFLEWLGEQRIVLCSATPGSGLDRWAPIMDGAQKLLSRYFEIDLKAMERELRAIVSADQGSAGGEQA